MEDFPARNHATRTHTAAEQKHRHTHTHAYTQMQKISFSFAARLSFPVEGNLISQPSLVEARISRRSDRFDCPRRSHRKKKQIRGHRVNLFPPNSLSLPHPPSVFSRPIQTQLALANSSKRPALSFARTYDKLKSHHPRDFRAITRATVPPGWFLGFCVLFLSPTVRRVHVTTK